jgi:hypothetical protein
LALGLPAAAQRDANHSTDRDLIPLLQKVQANWRSNQVLANQYVCDELTHTVVWNKSGKKIRDKSEKGESVFSAGTWYYRIVELNGIPLSAGKQASLQRHLGTC